LAVDADGIPGAVGMPTTRGDWIKARATRAFTVIDAITILGV
jgi:hypothetical protein